MRSSCHIYWKNLPAPTCSSLSAPGLNMEQVNFGYSLKNIPIPEEKVYLQMLINSSEKVMKSIRWKVFHFLILQKSTKKENFGFNSTKPAPSVPELKEFENGMAEIIKGVKFTKETNDFNSKAKVATIHPAEIQVF